MSRKWWSLSWHLISEPHQLDGEKGICSSQTDVLHYLPGGSASGQLWRSTCTLVLPVVVVAGFDKVMGEKQARILVEAGKDGYSVTLYTI